MLEPSADGFRNYLTDKQLIMPEEALVDKAQLLTLTAPEMTVLVGGLRVLGADAGGSQPGVFTERPETLTTTSWSTCSTSERSGSRPALMVHTRDATGRQTSSGGQARVST